MTSDVPASHNPNEDHRGKRLNAELEDFASTIRDVTRNVRRGYVYYQTCRGTQHDRCGHHEFVVCPRPTLWHDTEVVDAQRPMWMPEYQPSRDFAAAANLPFVITDDLLPPCPHTPLITPVFRDGVWSAEEVGDTIGKMWSAHVHHAATCGAPTHDPHHQQGTEDLEKAVAQGIARVNDTFRIINGVAHTDTDLLLVNPSGVPLLIVEDYRPSGRKKHISFSKSLSAQAGGGLVVLVRSDGHPGGPLVEEVWDMRPHPRFRGGEQLVGMSHGVRGYPALLDFIRDSSVFAPYLR